LVELTERGVVKRHVRDTSPPSVEYELTELGHELIPALDEIVKVGHKLKTKGYLRVEGQVLLLSGTGGIRKLRWARPGTGKSQILRSHYSGKRQ
jgi:hypothetical protein